jgi:hypothetical protein
MGIKQAIVIFKVHNFWQGWPLWFFAINPSNATGVTALPNNLTVGTFMNV